MKRPSYSGLYLSTPACRWRPSILVIKYVNAPGQMPFVTSELSCSPSNSCHMEIGMGSHVRLPGLSTRRSVPGCWCRFEYVHQLPRARPKFSLDRYQHRSFENPWTLAFQPQIHLSSSWLKSSGNAPITSKCTSGASHCLLVLLVPFGSLALVTSPDVLHPEPLEEERPTGVYCIERIWT